MFASLALTVATLWPAPQADLFINFCIDSNSNVNLSQAQKAHFCVCFGRALNALGSFEQFSQTPDLFVKNAQELGFEHICTVYATYYKE